MLLTSFALAAALASSDLDRTSPREGPVCAAESHATVAVTNGEIAYSDLGPVDGQPVLLVAGTDQQMIQWPEVLISRLQKEGLRPIVYDARDVGCSTHHVDAGPVDWPGVFGALAKGKAPPLPYTLQTMANDGFAVLDALGIRKADVLGVSGGATVAGEMAAGRPERVGRLVLLMANSGDPALPVPADPARLAALSSQPPPGADTATVAAYRQGAWAALAGPDSLMSREARRDLAKLATTRSWDPDGIGRSGAALIVAGDRRSRLAAVTTPTLVIHGSADPLISVAAGRGVADAIRSARFLLVPGMGHDLSAAALDAAVDALAQAASLNE